MTKTKNITDAILKVFYAALEDFNMADLPSLLFFFFELFINTSHISVRSLCEQIPSSVVFLFSHKVHHSPASSIAGKHRTP